MPGQLLVEIVSPSGRVFKGEAIGVSAPGVEGSFEVLYNHAPLIAAFEIGPLVVKTEEDHRILFATSGGFLEVLDNHVTVLAETAEPSSAIDVDRAKEAEQRALEALHRGDSRDRKSLERALERARNRTRVALSQVGRRN